MSDFRIIYTRPDDGGVDFIVPSLGVSVEEAIKNVPDGLDCEVVGVVDIPTDRTFRNGWERNGRTIDHNINKCKAIAHDCRRAARAAEFAPLDIEVTIPAKAAQAETARQAIRERYAVMQEQIDAAQTVDELKAIISQ